MDIYIHKFENKSFSEHDVLTALSTGRLMPNDLACLHGMNEWKPLFTLIDVPREILDSFDEIVQKEHKLLTIYLKNLEQSQQHWLEDESNLSRHGDFQNKVSLFQKQVYEFKRRFPEQEAGRAMESILFLKHALLKAGHQSYFRRASGRSETIAGGIVTGLIANRKETQQMLEALKIVDQAIAIYDSAMARDTRALLLTELGRKEDAIKEYEYIIAHYSDDEDVYFEARQRKDELMNIGKKSGMCFIATAAYESSLAPEVILFKRFRDEVLVKSTLGTSFVRTYYFCSPPLASLLSRVRFLRKTVRAGVLSPLAFLLRRYMR